ncbi:Cysteine--tRNA ligase [Anatilimnocola aggregata]|uniref:Cysteine--tRNA ligase n=1 Tax=Anatilimnocola aggregata TaxID=2528021 RepID=A0A517YMN1_9BACT|nr:cysteine--tRNA ligase [Anatilimnocola aggregata]QDU31474.1 Cysteine--tRNA ligase [Anatilimnocola aggregata]
MTIRVYNTLSKNKETFETVQPGKVGIYLCGPTVYKESHIGHMVGPVIFDTIKRYLTYNGYDVTWVVNITDVDDKLIQQQHERGIPMAAIADEMVIDYLNNLAGLGVDQIDKMPKATEHMQGIIDFNASLIKKGHAYVSDGDVLFDVAKDPAYGKLSNRSPEDQQGEGGGHASKKRNPGDFALWKAAKPGEPAWDSPWGKGRPGWHIECSAMCKAILGETFDIHGGGLDLMFPHHENELAQSQCCHGKPMVKYWMHNGLLRKAASAGKIGGKGDREAAADDGGKVSRSKGAGGLADDIARLGGERIRFFLLSTHYRSTVMFGEEGLAETAKSLDGFYRFFERFQKITKQRYFNLPFAKTRKEGDEIDTKEPLLKTLAEQRKNFLEKMDDDFNTGGAIAELFDMLRELNKFADQKNLERFTTMAPEPAVFSDPDVQTLVKGARVLRELTAILGVFKTVQPKRGGGGDGVVDKLMPLLIELRANARANKDFATGDLIRNKLIESGITLEDKKGGPTEWRIGSSS